MPKVTLNDIASGYSLKEAYNTNNDTIEAAFDNTLSRDGSTPNQMEADIDLNSNSLLNVNEINGILWEDVLGQEGSFSTFTAQRFSGDGSTTAFVLSFEPQNKTNTQIYIDGVYQSKATYSLLGSTITFSEAPPVGTDNIEVMSIATAPLGITTANQVTYTSEGGSETTVETKLRALEVADYTALAAIDNPYTGMTAIVTNDGIGGTFVYDATQAATNNGGTVIDGWVRQYSGPVNVKWFGVVGDGSNESAAFQSALTAAAGGVLFVPTPPSKYVVTGLIVPSDIVIEGEGHDTFIEMTQDSNAFARMFLINGLTGQPQANVTVRGLHLVGTVVADGFSEFRHLFYMWGVSNVTIENNYFTGWQGDALDVVWTPGTEGNENVTIQNNVFDGVNNDNRNAISVIGCDKLLIDNNIFKNCTRSNMPGAVDIEPNTGYTFIKLNAVTVSNNRFENIGGNVGAMAMFLPVESENFVEHPKNITIENNTFSNVFRGIHCTQIQSADPTATYPDINLKILNNKIDTATDRGFWLYGLKGVLMEGNTFTDCANGSRIGWSEANRGCFDVALNNNSFVRNGTTDGYGINVYRTSYLGFYGNKFDDIGVTAGGFGVPVNFASGPNANVAFLANTFITPTGKTTAAMTKGGGVTVTLAPNIPQFNTLNGLTTETVIDHELNGNTRLNGNFTMTGALGLTGNLTMTGDQVITGNLTVGSDRVRVQFSRTPASAGATGTAGFLAWDTDYIYVCVGTNSWKRVPITAW